MTYVRKFVLIFYFVKKKFNSTKKLECTDTLLDIAVDLVSGINNENIMIKI